MNIDININIKVPDIVCPWAAKRSERTLCILPHPSPPIHGSELGFQGPQTITQVQDCQGTLAERR